jgi:hypothetical protein
MATVKLGLKDLSLQEKVQLARTVSQALTGNATFPTPHPTLTQITALADGLQGALEDRAAKQQAAQAATMVVTTAEDALDAGLTALGAYVQSVSNGDEGKILSAGLSLKGAPASATRPPQPDSFAASLGELSGEIDLAWNRISGVAIYQVEYTTADPNLSATTWTAVPPVTRSSTTITGLTAGTRYWFRVCAVNTVGQGPWSDPATKMAQ